MGKTRRAAMALVLGIVLVLFSTAFAAAPAQTSMGRTASARTAPLQVQGAWSGWSEVSGNGFTPDAPGVVAFQTSKLAKAQMNLFVRGTNNRIYVNIFRAA